jgi:hypothetical protein
MKKCKVVCPFLLRVFFGKGKIMRMKTFGMVLIAIGIFINPGRATAVWDIWEDTTITSGTYNNIRIDYGNPNPGSIVLMHGGTSLAVEGYKTSCFTLSGEAKVSGFYVGGDASSFYLLDNGIVGNIEMQGSSKAYLRGGIVETYVAAFQSAEIHIYGYDFNLASNILSGYWASGEPFALWLRGSDTLPRTYLHEVPEPATLLLLSVSGGILLKRRFSFNRNSL